MGKIKGGTGNGGRRQGGAKLCQEKGEKRKKKDRGGLQAYVR